MKTKHERKELPESVRKQMEVRAESLLSRNEDTLYDVDDVMSRYAERYFRKHRYFDPARGSEEEFVGMLCSCVDAELIPELIADRERRQGMDWLDKAIETHGAAATVGDVALLEAAEEALLRRVLASDVRDTLRALPRRLGRVGAAFLLYGTQRAAARALGVAHATFEKYHWPEFCASFRKIWKESDHFRSEVR